MSIQPTALTNERPIIQPLTPQPSEFTPRAVGRDTIRPEKPIPAAASDTFESGSDHDIDGRHNAHLRRAAAQRQAASIAHELIDAPTHQAPPQLTPVSALPTPAPVATPPATKPETTAGQSTDRPDAVAPTSAEQEASEAASRTFTRDDINRIQSIFGARTGDERFDAGLDANGDGVINGVDLARVLNGLTASTPANAPKAADSMTREELLNGLLKAFGKTTSAGDANSVFDLSGDGRIDGADLARALNRPATPTSENGGNEPAASVRTIMHAFGAQTGDNLFSRSLDLNGDGVINGVDLARLLNGDG